MLGAMATFCHALSPPLRYRKPGFIPRAMLACAPLFLSACAVMPAPEPRPEISTAPPSPPMVLATSSETPPSAISATPNIASAPSSQAALAAPSMPSAQAAPYPDLPVRYRTPGLQEGRLAWSTPDEISAWLRDLTTPAAAPAQAPPASNRRRNPAIKAKVLTLSLQAGTSSEASPAIQALHLSTPRRTAPASTPATSAGPNATGAPTARPTVLLVGGPEASAATEALLLVARELVRGPLRPLLARIDVVVVPNTALAGQANLALPEDHVQLNTASAQILARLAQTHQATVVLSAGETPAMATPGTQIERLTDVTLVPARNPNLPEFLIRAAREWFEQPMLNALQAEGLADEQLSTDDPAASGESDSAGSLVNAATLKNRIGLQVLTTGLGRVQVQRRVHAQVTAISSALVSTARRNAELTELKPYIDREVTAQACREPVVMDADPQAQPAPTRIKPCGYWLAADASQAVQRLRLHGVQVMRLAEPASLLGDSYQNSPPAASLGQGTAGTPFKTPVKLVRGVIDAPADSFYVSVAQAQGNLIVSALEPDAPSSLVALGLLNPAAGLVRIMTPPAVRLEALP